MQDVRHMLRNHPPLAVDPAVMEQLRTEFALVKQMGKSVLRGGVWKARVLQVQKELARLGYSVPTAPPSKLSKDDVKLLLDGMGQLLEKQLPKTQPLPRKKVTSGELAVMYGVSKRTIQQWAHDGVISSIPPNSVGRKLGKKVILFDVEQVEKDLIRWERKALGRA